MIYFKVIDLDRCTLHVAPCFQRSPSLRTGDYLGTFLLKCTLLYCGEWGLGEAPADSLLDLRNQTGVSKRVAKPNQP